MSRLTKGRGAYPQLARLGPKPKRFYRNSSPVIARVASELYFVGRLKQHEIGRIFDLRQNTVSRMVSGRTWDRAQ